MNTDITNETDCANLKNELNELNVKKRNMEEEIENLEKKRKELIEFNEKYKNEYENKLKELEKERNKLEKEFEEKKKQAKSRAENYVKEKKEEIKKEKEEFEKEKKDFENRKLEFEKEKEDFENRKLEFEKEKQKFENNKNNENNNENIIQNKNNNGDTQEDSSNEDINNNKKNEEKYEEPSSIPKGLLNLGLSCYMNSLLQCLYYIPEFREYFIKNNFDDEQLVCKALAKTFYGLKYNKKDYFEATEFKDIMGSKNSLFSGKKAGDSKDLFFNLIDSLLTELNTENEENDENENEIDLSNKEDVFKELLKENKNDNIINQLFIGYYETKYICPTNKENITYSFQNESFILFELEKIKSYFNTNDLSIELCFAYYYRLQQKTSFYCNICEKIEEGNCYEKIYRPSKIMVIILDRGHGKTFKGKVEINSYLDLKNCIDDEKYEESTFYKLICISTHSGSSSEKGHYTARCLTDNNTYYYFSDTQNHQINEDDLFDDEPYILFYKRVNKEELNIINKDKKSNNNIDKTFNEKIKQIKPEIGREKYKILNEDSNNKKGRKNEKLDKKKEKNKIKNGNRKINKRKKKTNEQNNDITVNNEINNQTINKLESNEQDNHENNINKMNNDNTSKEIIYPVDNKAKNEENKNNEDTNKNQLLNKKRIKN